MGKRSAALILALLGGVLVSTLSPAVSWFGVIDSGHGTPPNNRLQTDVSTADANDRMVFDGSTPESGDREAVGQTQMAGQSRRQGRVVGEDELPIAGVTVMDGRGMIATTGPDGIFTVAETDEPVMIDVVAKGYRPIRREYPGGAQTQPLEIRLGELSRSINGRLVDAANQPLVGWRVDVVLPDSGSAVRAKRNSNLDYLVRGSNRQVTTDDRGAFQIDGLWRDRYSIGACQPDSLQNQLWKDVSFEDSPVTLRVDAGWLFDVVDGWVRSSAGQACPGVSVYAQLDYALGVDPSMLAIGSITQTGVDGRFLLAGIPKVGVSLCVEGAPCVATEARLPDSDAYEITVNIEVELCHSLRLDLGATPSEAAYVEFVGETQELLQVTISIEGGTDAQRRIWKADDAQVLDVSLPPNAREMLAVDKDGSVLRRYALGSATMVTREFP
jgi:hypothetical protein